MNDDLKAAITRGELILFLGAGASKHSINSLGQPLPDGATLAKRLAVEASLPYQNEPLDLVYSAARQKLQSRLDGFLAEVFRHTTPSPAYLVLAQYAWRRIYTLNIDDSLDRALEKHSKQRVTIHTGRDPLIERDPVFVRLDYVKLNGCVSRLKTGIIFSPAEYARATTSPMPWYEESSADFMRMPFLFVGTKLDEPLLKFHIERYKQINKAQPGISFVLTPSISAIERLDLKAYNIEHLAGTLGDFVRWLQAAFKKGIAPIDLAKASIPQLAELINAPNKQRYAALFSDVTHVSKATLRTGRAPVAHAAVLPFYKGFKPTWTDVLHGVPSDLDALSQFLAFFAANNTPGALFPIIGPAGSGKTTLLMQAALQISMAESTAVYFIAEPVNHLRDVLKALDDNDAVRNIVVAIDKMDYVADQLAETLQAEHLRKTVVLGAARQNIWHKRTSVALGRLSRAPFELDEFTTADARKLLAKLEQFGPWTRLGQFSPERRLYELNSRAQRQLLIALLEATSGRGFEQIIENDYDTLTSDAERVFLVLVGLATINRLSMPMILVDRALVQLSLAGRVSDLSPALSGIVIARGDRLFGRHELYVRHLLDRHIDPSIIEQAIKGLLRAFALNRAPVIQNIPKVDAAIYKATINHRFLFRSLRGKKALVIGLYQSLEKSFELDGLFWLQYGLSLRDFGEQVEALEKLRIAVNAYRMDHTEHALAQQLIIMAESDSNRTHAMASLDEAREILLRLNETVTESDDTYPIVTLAEGHTKVLRNTEGEEAARTVAGQYANQVKQRLDQQPSNARVRACWEFLFKYAATGSWPAEYPKDAAGLSADGELRG